MISLFPDQEQAVADLRRSVTSGHLSPLLVAPCAFGKTVCFSYLCARLNENGKRAVVLVHRDELLQQCADTLMKFRVQHGRVEAGGYYDRRYMTHVASVFSLSRKVEHVAVPDYVIVDEAHHCVASSTWGKVVDYWRQRNPRLKLIGVSATPVRLDGSGLGEVFDDLILGPSTADLIAAGRLSPFRMFAPAEQLDLSGLHSRGGDFIRSETAGKMDKPTITGSALAQYRKHADGLPAVVFCCSIEHAHHTAETFQSAGYRFAAIDGKMKMEDRRERIRDLERGVLHGLTSCSLVDEGFNMPGIVAAIDLAPTQSLSRCIQRWGRALRIAPGKTHAIILDHANNTQRHGLPDDEREWSLAGCKRKGKAERDPDDLPVKQCKHCYAINKALASTCRECGQVFVAKARTVAEVEGELQEVDMDAMREQLAAKRAQAQAKSVEDMVRNLGYSHGRATHIVQAREEKAALRNRALELAKETRSGISVGVIGAMKPKELRTLIEAMEEQLKGEAA